MPVIETALTHLLAIEHPIILAPMGSAAGGKLPSAVTNAGGLGKIGSGPGSREGPTVCRLAAGGGSPERTRL
jgi:nitronate monooxygenase